MTRILMLAPFLSLATVAMAQDAVGTTYSELLDSDNKSTPTFSSDAGTSPATVSSPAVSQPVTTGTVAPSVSTTTSVIATADLQTTETSGGGVSDAGTSVTTPEGVIYQVLKPGTGPKESSTQTLLLHYTLFLTNGQKIESSRDTEFPVPLKLQRNTNSFIKGFEIGTAGMRVGEIRRIYIPAELGYGEKGNEAIPPNTPLLFETELVDLK